MTENWRHEQYRREAEDWRVGFKRAMVETIYRLGYIADPVVFATLMKKYYPRKRGYLTFETLREKIQEIGINYDRTTVIEDEWTEFVSTFEGTKTMYGVRMTLVLLDGTKVDWRYGKRLNEFLLEVIKY